MEGFTHTVPSQRCCGGSTCLPPEYAKAPPSTMDRPWCQAADTLHLPLTAAKVDRIKLQTRPTDEIDRPPLACIPRAGNRRSTAN